MVVSAITQVSKLIPDESEIEANPKLKKDFAQGSQRKSHADLGGMRSAIFFAPLSQREDISVDTRALALAAWGASFIE